VTTTAIYSEVSWVHGRQKLSGGLEMQAGERIHSLTFLLSPQSVDPQPVNRHIL
jgi:hypothetical protein